MRITRIFLAAAAATVLSVSAFAAAPTASQVSVPASAEVGHHQAKIDALFPTPEERMMFRLQMHDATHGMDRAHKKAYRHQEMKRVRAMNDSEKSAWRHDLDAKWSALPAARREQVAAKAERREQRHESRGDRPHHGGRHRNQQEQEQAPQQQ